MLKINISTLRCKGKYFFDFSIHLVVNGLLNHYSLADHYRNKGKYVIFTASEIPNPN